ncbi:hypothetical protein [Oceanobacter mangrovi]|uniref:hypothetical protein n=1 Tax=Oceanobacter mangrovi TaxID=2862510 RepID=UPI001C8DCDD3|nr:hypothetical protein [Oceanobacter mangrovi]
MTFLKLLSLVAVVAITGCSVAAQKPVALNEEAFTQTNSIAIIATEVPTPDTTFPGASCLICAGIAIANHSALTEKVVTFSTEELVSLPEDLKQVLAESGKQVVISDKPLVLKSLPDSKSKLENSSKKDFSGLAKELGVSKALVIDVQFDGVLREYSSGYIPAAAPVGYVYGYAYLVNPETSQYEWFMPLNIREAVEGEWDEPADFPKLTNAYYSAVEKFRDAVLNAFTAK